MIPDPNLVEDLRLLEAPSYLWIWLTLAGLLAVGVVVMVVRRLRSRVARVKPAPPGRAAHELALEALEKLASLLRPDESRRYGIESTTIIRGYIEARFGIRAPMQATEEFLVAASESQALGPQHRELLQDYLERCDLLKFARTRARVDELGGIHEAALRFVKESQAGGDGGRGR